MSNIDPKFQRFSNDVQKENKTIVENSTRMFKQFINISIILLALGIVGCFDWVNFSFSFDTLMKSEFWVHLILRATLLILLYNVGLNLFWDKTLSTDETLNGFKKQYEEKNKLKDVNFEEFIERVLNPKLKKEAWLAHIKKRIYKLDKKAKDYDKLLFASILPERQEEKKKNRYCIKKQKLLDLMSDAYLDKELPNITIKYERIDAAVFNMDVNGEAVVSNYKVKTSVGRAKAQKTATNVLTMIFGSVFISSILLDPDFGELAQDAAYAINAAINMAMDLLFCGWQMFRGVVDTPKLINQEYTVAYANRCKILDQYIIWNAENPESKAHKISTFIEKQDDNKEVK